MTNAPLCLLTNVDDNVIIVTQPLAAGTEVLPGVVTIDEHRLGQKLARVPIVAGSPVLRYGAPIGAATADIAPGELVHDHNVISNYQRATTRRGDQT